MSSGAISTATSGMFVAQNNIEVGASNLSASDAKGFKSIDSITTNFVTRGKATGGGAQSKTLQDIDKAGVFQPTNVGSDLAVEGGDSFFVVRTKDEKTALSGTVSLRKDGAGTMYDTISGSKILAWKLDANENLPQAHSLIDTLEEINVKNVVSDASSTSNIDLTANLESTEHVAPSTNIIFDITSSDSINASVTSKVILAPEDGFLEKGNGILVEIDEGKETTSKVKILEEKILEYGGFVESAALPNAGVQAVTAGTVTLNVRKNGTDLSTISITPTGTTNLEVMRSIAEEINASAGEGQAVARVITEGTSSTLYISAADSNFGLSLSASDTRLDSTRLNLPSSLAEFETSSSSDVVGRFSNFFSLKKTLEDMGIDTVELHDNVSASNVSSIGATLIVDTTGYDGKISKAISFSDYNNTGSSTKMLEYFNLNQGYQAPLYNPYDGDNNMAGGNSSDYNAHYTRDVPIYDSQGNKHILIADFLKVGVNQWAYELYARRRNDVDNNRPDGLLQAGTLNFDKKGELDNITGSKQVSDSKALADPSSQLSLTPSGGDPVLQVVVGTPGSETQYDYTYHKKIMELGNASAFGNTLRTIGASANMDLAVDGMTYTVTSPTNAAAPNDKAALDSIASDINNFSGMPLEAVVVETAGTPNTYHLAIKAQDPQVSITATGVLATSLGHIAADDVPENSFRSYNELAELVNFANGAEKVAANVIKSGGQYVMRIEPVSPGHFLTFSGTNTFTAAPPFGDGTTLMTLDEALELDDTTLAKQISSPNDDLVIKWSPNIGTDDNTISVAVGGGDNVQMSQTSAQYSLKLFKQNGVATGQLTGVQFDGEGYVIAQFSNGTSKKVYKLPIGVVPNPNGLQDLGSGLYAVQEEQSGQLNLKQAGLDGAGNVLSHVLETSNVQLATQMTNLLIAERSYQANARVVNVIDRTNEELVRLIG